MGYRGKLREQEEARRLRATGKTLQQIADELQVSKSSVSRWVRDVPFTPSKRRYGPHARFHPWKERRLREIAECDLVGAERIGIMSEETFFAAGVALYAGEGSKTSQKVAFANTDDRMISFFCAWLRRFFEVDEARLRVRVYLHDGLISTQHSSSGPMSPACRSPSSASPTAPSVIRRSARRSTRAVAAT